MGFSTYQTENKTSLMKLIKYHWLDSIQVYLYIFDIKNQTKIDKLKNHCQYKIYNVDNDFE